MSEHTLQRSHDDAGPLQPSSVFGHGAHRIIVSHGWMGDCSLFDSFIEHVDPDRYTYAFVDARGYGKRMHEAGPKTIEASALDVVRVADFLGWKQFHVLGHSMGGMVAQRLMVDAPERMLSAILVAPVPASGATLDAARRQLLERAIHEPEIRRELININTGGLHDDAWLDELLSTSLSSTCAEGMLGHLASWSGTNFQHEVEGACVRVLTIVGEADPGCSESKMTDTVVRWFPHGQLVVLEQAGHYPMRECPAVLAATIGNHVEESGYSRT